MSVPSHSRSKSVADVSIGSTRSLTAQFLRLRNDAKKARGLVGTEERETSKLLGADVEAGPSGQSPPSMPAWVARSEKVKAEMGLVKERIGKLKDYHAKSLLVSFEAGDDSKSRTEALTREVQLSLKRLGGEVRAIPAAARPGDDAQVVGQVQKQLSAALMKLTQEFRTEETRFLNRVERQKGLGAGSTLGLLADEELTGGDPGFTEDQSMRLDQAEAVILQRDEEIRKIVETIVELASIMQDLATLITEQGTMVDRIDYNIAETAVKVEEGVRELVKAEKTQKQGRMMLCIMALCVAVVFMMIIVIVRHH